MRGRVLAAGLIDDRYPSAGAHRLESIWLYPAAFQPWWLVLVRRDVSQ